MKNCLNLAALRCLLCNPMPLISYQALPIFKGHFRYNLQPLGFRFSKTIAISLSQ